MHINLLKDNRGMTMTEVLMAFMVLIIIMGMLSGIIAFSKKMYMNASDLRRSQETVSQEIYKKDFAGEPDKTDIKVYRIIPEDNGKYKKDFLEDQYFAVGVSQKSVPVSSESDNMNFLVFSSVSSNSTP